MRIGINDKRAFIEISEEARKANLAIFGIKNTGKAFTLIPALFDQDLKMKSKGITIIVNTPELAWYLYGMAKVEGRRVDMLKPSINFDILNSLLFKPEWDYDEINNIYDYEKAVKEKRVTIIDMEEEKYGEKAVRAASMLLLQLQSVMVKDRQKKIEYSVYVDDAASYMPYIKNLLKYGDYYGFMTTLFLKSRQELDENVIDLDNYVRNFILLQGINYEDAKYFSSRMDIGVSSEKSGTQMLMDRDYGAITCEYLENKTFKRRIEEGILIEFPEDKKKEFTEKGLYWKKRNREIKSADHNYQLEKESEALAIKTNDGDTYLDNIKEKVEVSIQEKPVEDVKPQKNKEPQLNQRIKTENVKKEPDAKDYSILDEFDLPGSVPISEEPEIEEEIEPIEFEEMPTEEIEVDVDEFDLNADVNSDVEFDPEFDLNIEFNPEDDLEDIKIEPVQAEEFDLSAKKEPIKKTFQFGNKNQPFRKIKNTRIEKALEPFKI